MISLILFIVFMTFTPLFLIKYIECENGCRKKYGMYTLVSFTGAVLSEIYGSLLGALGVLVLGVVIWLVMLLCRLLRRKLMKPEKLEVISDFTVGFYRNAIITVFFIMTVAGTVSHMYDGIFEVAVTYALTPDRLCLALWWVPAVLFAVLQMLLLVSDNAGSFGKKLLGYLLVSSLIVMAAGDFSAIVFKGSTTVVVDVIWDIINGNGYPPVVSEALLVIMRLFELYIICLAVGYTAAFVFTLFRGRSLSGRRDIKVVSVEEMRRADEYTIKNGVDGKVLMGRAAAGIYDSVDWKNKRIAIVAGSGNNGGDGYALASLLADNGIEVVIYRTSERFSVDGKFYYEQAMEKGVLDTILTKDTDLSGYDIVVDCILGTGFKGMPEGAVADGINVINNSGAYVVSADINSGMDGDSGKAILAVKSDLTVSVGFYKKGMLSKEAKKYVGELTNVDIGIVLV